MFYIENNISSNRKRAFEMSKTVLKIFIKNKKSNAVVCW